MDARESRPMCYRCYRPKKSCFCDLIRPFATNCEFRLLMHPKEAKVAHVGTGRMANQALVNCKIIIDENFDQNSEVQKILISNEYHPMILYPGESATNLSEEKIDRKKFQSKTPLIFIIDGTWPSAKSMMRDSKCLHDLPRISFNSKKESRYDIRHQPARYCLSTIESIYVLLEELEKNGLEQVGKKKQTLLDSLDKMVEFQRVCAEDPSIKSYRRKSSSYKTPSERRVSKKWKGRMVCFEDRNYD